jgi:hypothetical protein
MMRTEIPAAVLAVTADMASERETHASLDSLFLYAGAPGDPPEGSKHVKALAWLRQMNRDSSVDPLRVLGRIIEGWLETPIDPHDACQSGLTTGRDKLLRTLSECNLQYIKGGKVAPALGSPTRALADFIRDRDLESINQEFDRAVQNAASSPREAISAASNILESTCKVVIEDDGLELPAKQDLQSVWNVVRKHLGIDPSKIEDQDLQQILTGLISVVKGIGALRTHASSAHGAGKPAYKLEPRHARLAIHAAHTLSLFVLESWRKKADG